MTDRIPQQRGNEDFHLFTEGDDLVDAMLADIAISQSEILLEMYIFKEDGVGRQFVTALLQAAARGVSIQIRLDALGSGRVFTQATASKLRECGVAFSWDNQWNWWHPLRYQRRNHRKLLVIDERIAYVGGFNIGEESSFRFSGAARWRDTHVRLMGPVAKQAAVLFRSYRNTNACGEERWFGHSLLMSNYSRRCRYRLRCLFNGRFGNARSKIWLTTPYFVPDSRTERLLMKAAGRGIDVRILLPGKSDIPVTQWAARMSYARLARSGVRIYEYAPRFLHAKTIVIDDDWSTVGTSNFDYRSFFQNHELNFVSISDDINGCLSKYFEGDLMRSKEIDLHSLENIGIANIFQRLIAFFARKYL
ncbi:phospholipase D-like domain-containing protein [Novosphingobium malaysiense]|uniref:phospholipase D-like domain-containing protein n=1 Tax=Novosphingobium malaysiense TaxID=1348853 RepID=UPI000689A575|nr:phospholipase D-like domain-containing protein [Novosphingobium malaysiense]MCP5399940.1 cardiolipin synthase B [Sphingomonas sp.]